ncbi:hypothetical protein BH09ACT7_BH09ACT7_28610 [soil metagenome]
MRRKALLWVAWATLASDLAHEKSTVRLHL